MGIFGWQRLVIWLGCEGSVLGVEKPVARMNCAACRGAAEGKDDIIDIINMIEEFATEHRRESRGL